jgi:tRNA(Ile)-lysidine synthase
VATVQAAGQSWIDDPSNRDMAYARVRLRQTEDLRAEAGLSAERLAATAARLGRARAAVEGEAAAVSAQAVIIHPAGFVRLDPAVLFMAAEEIGMRVLAALLAMVGGEAYPPRFERLERLYHDLARRPAAGGRTLGGCRILSRGGGLLICREAAALAPPVAALPGETVAWDNRFRLRLPSGAPQGLMLGALGGAALAGVPAWPAVLRAGLPALSDKTSVVCVPALGYLRNGFAARWLQSLSLRFRPTRPFSGAGFTVV